MADGVKMASGYVELTVRKAGDAMKEITAEITNVGKQAEKVGKEAGKSLNDGFVRGASDAGKSIRDAITEGAKKAGEDAGKAASDALNDGFTKGATKAGESVREAITKGAKKAGDEVSKTKVEPKIEPKVETHRARDAFKELGKEIVVMVDKAANDAGITLEGVVTGVAREAGRKVGQELHDAISNVPYLGDAARNIEGWINPAVDGFRGLNDAVTAFKDKDAAGALNGLASALDAVGQSKAAGTVKDVADKAAPLQEKISSIKGDITGVTDGFLALAGNQGRIAGAFSAIASAAGPLAATLATLDTLMPGWHEAASGVLDQIQGKKGFNAKDWFNTLIPGTNIIDRTLGPVVNGPDPTKGVQSPIPAKPGVSAIPLPGSAPAVEPGYTAVPGSGDPFAALSPASGAKAAPSGLRGPQGSLNLSTIPVAVQKYANDCIDASARIILSHSGVNMSEDQLKDVIAPGGSIESQAAGMNQLAPSGRFVPMQGSGGSPEVMFNAIKASIDRGAGSILNVAPGSSIAGRPFPEGHFIAVTGYNQDGTINLSDTAGGKQYSVSQADAFQATRGRGIVAGTGLGPGNMLRPTGFDDGGVLPPGMQLINNASGQPEIVLTQDQAKNAMQGMPGMGAGPSDTPLASGQSPGENGAAALTDLMGGQTGEPGGKDLRTQGYIPAGAGGGGQAGTSLWSGAMQMGAQAVNGLIDQAASAAATAISAAATAGSFGAGGQAAGSASSFLIGIGTQAAKRGVQYGFQMAGIAGDALTEILMPFGVPRFFQTDPSQFMPQLPNMAAAVTTGEKAQQTQDNPQGAQQAGINPSGPVQPGQLPGQQVVGAPAPIAQPGTGDFTPAPAEVGGISSPAAGAATPSLAPPVPAGPQAPKSGPMAPPPPQQQSPQQPPPNKPAGPLDFLPMDMPGVFDSGGWLMPNGIAINNTNRPEPILNDEQWGNLHAIAAQGMPQPDPRAISGGGNDYSVHLQATVTDVNQLMSEASSRQRLQMMRHAGRP